MSVATPKSQAREPIQLDIIIVCRKQDIAGTAPPPPINQAMETAKAKLRRLRAAGLSLSRNDRKIVLFGQLLTTLQLPEETDRIAAQVDGSLELTDLEPMATRPKTSVRKKSGHV